MIRSLLIPALVAVWGTGVVVYGLTGGGTESANPGYELGADAALVTGAVMAVLGAIYFVRGLRERS